MAFPRPAASKESKSTGDVVSELWALLKDYGRQETVDPLKHLGRFLGFGAAAALCWGIAGAFVALALTRLLQVEGRRWLHGNWSFVPYVLALVVIGGAAGFSVKQIKKGKAS